MPQLHLSVEGMHCEGCENRVRNGLSRLEGVRAVEADHEAGTADVQLVAGQGDEQAIEEAVEELGYSVRGIASG